MVFLDPDIADYHKPNADHHGVILEMPYSAFAKVLENERLGGMGPLEQAVDSALTEKNQQREIEGMKPYKATTVTSRYSRKSPKRPVM